MKLLVVEDEKKIADSLKRGLEQEGFSVDVAYDGLSGYDLASMEKYNVIILDLMLPGKRGDVICMELRNEGNNTPILMLTALGEVEDKVKGLNLGADDYVVKPFAFNELVARIHALTRRPSETLNVVIEYEDIKLDTIKREVTRKGKLIDLSRREFQLLEYLLKNQNVYVSKDQILENIWPFESEILPNTIEVYIGYLRGKLEKAFPKSKKVIQTKRGFGYKIGK